MSAFDLGINRNLHSRGFNKEIRMNFSTVGLIIYTVCFMTLYTFFSSNGIKIALLLISILFLTFDLVFKKRKVLYTKVDLMWFVFILYFLFNILIMVEIDNIVFFNISIYFGSFVFLLLAKFDTTQFTQSFKFIKVISVIYALSIMFQYVNTDIYVDIILPLFTSTEQGLIMRQLSRGHYTGITFQVAYIAGFLVIGLGVLFFIKNKKTNSAFQIIMILLLIFALILTGKRGHTLFMVLALLITYIASVTSIKKIKRILKSMLLIFILGIVFLFLIESNVLEDDSPIKSFTDRIEETIVGLQKGEDITSGRAVLYDFSWNLFLENPILGAGWMAVQNNSIGLINDDKGSHSHNIYIQLLSEMGLVGFTLFIIPLLFIYYKSIKLFKTPYIQSDESKLGILKLSFFLQTFFILYGFTGNLLTDHIYILMYFYSVSIVLSLAFYVKRPKAIT